MDALEQSIEHHHFDKQERTRQLQQTIIDHEETIRCLKEHISRLEQINFQQELSAINMTNNSVLETDMRHRIFALEQQLLEAQEIQGTDEPDLQTKLTEVEQNNDLLNREVNQLRLENNFMIQAKALDGCQTIDKLHDVVSLCFRDDRIYNLLDLRAMVLMACELAQPALANDLLVQDKLY
jgi:predicted RNase H-like nuclease (RuvC/YqgF family)